MNTTLVVCCVYFWSENQGIVVMAATATEDPRALLEELLVEPVIGNGLSLEEMRKFFPSKSMCVKMRRCFPGCRVLIHCTRP